MIVWSLATLVIGAAAFLPVLYGNGKPKPRALIAVFAIISIVMLIVVKITYAISTVIQLK